MLPTQRTLSRFLATIGLLTLLGFSTAACQDDERIVLRNDSGVFITLQSGEEFDVVLEANPSTGYRWEIDPEASGAALVEMVGEPAYSSESDLPGSGGKTTFTFRALEEGSGLLRLRFWRSFEPDAGPLRVFEVNITVDEE
jgi:inhibitor of cysteine peptidase